MNKQVATQLMISQLGPSGIRIATQNQKCFFASTSFSSPSLVYPAYTLLLTVLGHLVPTVRLSLHHHDHDPYSGQWHTPGGKLGS